MASRRFLAAPTHQFGPANLAGRLIAHAASLLVLGAIAGSTPGCATESDAPDAALAAVVRLQATVPSDARSATYLGTERDGSGVVIDGEGLVVTAGYLIVEAESILLTLSDGRKVAANPIAYDNDTGFGLVRATEPLKVKPIELGDSTPLRVRDRALVASSGGSVMALPALVVSRRSFAGYWEYLLENAIFTVPAHPAFSGAALISQDGKLVGIGSLAVPNAVGDDAAISGNMFIPINRLKPILADLLEKGRSTGPKHPWLGINSQAVLGRLFVARVTAGGPAATAGIKEGDLVLGIGGRPVTDLEGFYRRLWASGEAGATVQLDVLQGIKVNRIDVKSVDRYDFLKLGRSY